MMSPDIYFILLFFMLLVFPKFLQRFGVPSAITSFCVGLASGPIFSIVQSNQIINILSTLGIVTLFLFAGLEADLPKLTKGKSILFQHILIFLTTLCVATSIFCTAFEFDVRSSALIAIALLTPSAGFILDSLRSLHLGTEQQFWIKSKTISAEIVALGVLFVVLQSQSWIGLVLSTVILIAMIYLLPLIFKGVAKWIIPYAPKSEFTFLIMVAISCALITKKLGVYYLVGSFIVGISVQRFRENLPAFSSEKMMDAIELFSSFFIPFYFFNAGLGIPREAFSLQAVALGLFLLAIFIPLRIFSITFHRWWVLKESLSDAKRIGIRILPTFVFTLVLVDILKNKFDAPAVVLGALVLYTVINTIFPSLILKEKPLEFENQHLTDIEVEPTPRT